MGETGDFSHTAESVGKRIRRIYPAPKLTWVFIPWVCVEGVCAHRDLWEAEGRTEDNCVLQGSEMPSQHCASCSFREELQKAPRFLRGIGF